jgi:hypothetical protein
MVAETPLALATGERLDTACRVDGKRPVADGVFKHRPEERGRACGGPLATLPRDLVQKALDVAAPNRMDGEMT